MTEHRKENTKQSHLVFVCVSNRGRSVFAEYFMRKIFSEPSRGLGEQVKVTSAGFIPQAIKDQIAELQIGFPEPFFSRPMAEATRTFLSERGMSVPADWRSKELTTDMVNDATLLITAIHPQKDDLVRLYPEAAAKIRTIREISRWEEPFLFEDLTRLPKDDSYWHYVEEDEEFVKTILSEVERSLTRALPDILNRLGFTEERTSEIVDT